MANRKGVFIGAYVPAELKRALQQRATSEHRTLSQEITRILEEAVKGPALDAATPTPCRDAAATTSPTKVRRAAAERIKPRPKQQHAPEPPRP